MKVACPRCRTQTDATPGLLMTCATCGFSDVVPQHLAGASTPKQVWREATIVQPARAPVSMGLAVAALLLNVLLLPGLGTVIAGRTQEGIWQLVLSVGAIFIAFVLFLSIIGILLVPLVILAPIAAWIWGLISGIQLISEAQ